MYSKYNRECWVDGQWMLGCTANTTESVGLMVSGCWGVQQIQQCVGLMVSGCWGVQQIQQSVLG